ncbi:sulfide-quinone oxidoreductase [Hydrogenivirga caldilitoris]|uniref:Sulfide-quinone reductase n=1 Tax=Hydrogenivirga caldilitoris TaxID=246264 RepID=A0A497XWZ9_9AQUI|nr:FAD-dependent oxidoreductase [Hydrogenivirga caldilitoris]RLJ71293.1 sulfide-quinone oxidoreductase [Hydrogenivirga caldilitoris]
MEKHVVIIGGGIGGIATAYNLRKLDKNLKVTIVSNKPYFGFTPAFPHLALGWRRFEDITIPLAPLLPRFNIGFINEAAESIDPKSNKVKLRSGKEIEYDYLVIATGPKLVFGAEGQEENSSSVCTAEHAMETNRKLQEFYQNPGPVVIGAIPGVSCFGPAYEFAFMLNHELVKRNIRHKVPITYVTSEPYIGHLGLGGVGPSRRMMEDLFAEKDIKYITNVKVTKIEKDRVVYEDLDGNSQELEAKFTMFMPRFQGPEVVASAGDEVANPMNKMVIVNRCFQNPTYRNIYGVGVVTAIPPVEKTPIPTGAPKTGQMIEGMAMAVALNIINDIHNSPDRYAPTLAAICIADMGKEAAGFIANPVIPPRAWVKTKKAKWVHYLKTAFEKYFLWKVRRGDIAPWFEEKALELFLHLKPAEPCKDCEGAPGSRC